MKHFFLLSTLLAVTVYDAVAEKKCYVCTGVAEVPELCGEKDFNADSSLVKKVSCPNNCATYKHDVVTISTITRSCDVGNILCANGSGPGPAGVGEVECCDTNLCNGATRNVIQFSVLVITTTLTILTIS